jgi:hypothetical protein
MIELFGGFITIPKQGLEDGIIFTALFALLSLIVWWADRRG